MKTWLLKGSKENQSVVLAGTETDANTYFLGVRKLRVMTEILGLIHLASYLESKGWKFEQAFVADESEFSKHCSNAVVGISTQINNYENSLQLVTIAKKNGAKLVVMGGPHATNVADQIIANQHNVDFVVRGQGEVAMHEILEGEHFDRGVIDGKHIPFNLLPPRNRSLWSQLWKDEHVNLSGRKWSMISFTEGCPQAQMGNPCVFCSIRHAKKISCRTIEQMVDEMKQLQSFGIGALEIGDDDFPGVFQKKHLGKLIIAMKNSQIDLKFFIHARTVSIVDLQHLEMLKEMGVEVIQIGIESGDIEIKSHMSLPGKNLKTTPEKENQLIEWCKKTGTKIQATFIVGLPGETNDSMQATFNRALDLASQRVLWSLMIDPLVPLPESRAFQMLCKKYPEFSGKDEVNTGMYIEKWFEEFTEVNLKEFLKLRTDFFSQNDITVAGMLLKI